MGQVGHCLLQTHSQKTNKKQGKHISRLHSRKNSAQCSQLQLLLYSGVWWKVVIRSSSVCVCVRVYVHQLVPVPLLRFSVLYVQILEDILLREDRQWCTLKQLYAILGKNTHMKLNLHHNSLHPPSPSSRQVPDIWPVIGSGPLLALPGNKYLLVYFQQLEDPLGRGGGGVTRRPALHLQMSMTSSDYHRLRLATQ